MTKLELLAHGRTAELYNWGEDKVLKLFRKDVSFETIEYEFTITLQVQGMIKEVPKAIEIIELDGRSGIIFEKVAGSTMLHTLSKSPWTYKGQAKALAELHKKVHQNNTSPKQLPTLKEELKTHIEKGDKLGNKKMKVLNYLEALPEGNVLLHGDFHPDNIIITPSRKVIIDWVTAVKGDPSADVARTILLVTLGDLPPGMSKIQTQIMQYIRKDFCKKYVSTYKAMTGITNEQIERWLVPLAAARLNEHIPDGEKDRLIELIFQ